MKKDNNNNNEMNLRPKEYDICSLGSILFQLTQPYENYNGDWEKYLKNREYEAADGYLGGILFLFLKLELR